MVAKDMVAQRSPSLYELLEVSSGATFEEIEQSYQRIAAYLGAQSLAVYSILDGDEAQQQRTRLDEAYRTLSDPDRRAAYDRARREEYPPITVPVQASTATSTADTHVAAGSPAGSTSADDGYTAEHSDALAAWSADAMHDKHLPVRGRTQPRQPIRGPGARTGRTPLYGRDVNVQGRDPRSAADVQPREHKPRYGRLQPRSGGDAPSPQGEAHEPTYRRPQYGRWSRRDDEDTHRYEPPRSDTMRTESPREEQRQAAETRGPGSDVREPISQVHPTSDIRYLASETRGPTSEVRYPKSEVRGPTSEVRYPKSEVRGPTSEVRYPTSEVRGPTSEVRYPTSDVRGPTSDIRYLASETRRPTSDVRGPTPEVRYPISDARTPGRAERVDPRSSDLWAPPSHPPQRTNPHPEYLSDEVTPPLLPPPAARAERQADPAPSVPTVPTRVEAPPPERTTEPPELVKTISDVVEPRQKSTIPAPAALSATAKSKRRILTPTITVTPETEFNGGVMRNLRESAGATLDELAEMTKVGKRYLIAIENNDFAALPAAVYTRGFVTELARTMGLDPAPVAKSFMALYAKHRGAGG